MTDIQSTNSEEFQQRTDSESLQGQLSEPASTVNNEQQIIIPVIEESIQVGKKEIETGKIRITKTVTETPESYDIELLQENIQVERVPVNTYIESPVSTRYEGDVTIIPVIKEVLVVEKRLMLVEEIRVTKTRTTTHETNKVSVRKEDIQIEKIQTGNTSETSM